MLKDLMGIFRVILLGLFVVVFVYVTHQLTRFAGLPLWEVLLANLFVLAILALVASMPLFFWSERRLEHKPWHDRLFGGAHFGMAYINFLLSFVIIRDIASFVASYSVPSFDVTVLYNADSLWIMLLLPFILILLGNMVVRSGPRIKNVALRFSNLPDGLKDLRVMHITDLHISSSVPVNFIEKLVKRVNHIKPDLIVYTGDILDSQASRHPKEFELLTQMRAGLGNFYVPGNHEYYWNVDQALEAFNKIGFKILINEATEVEINGSSLQIAGVPDPASHTFHKEEPNFDKLASQLKPGSFKILLSHQPSLIKVSSTKGYDLQLSGHTHGGQFFPWNLLIGFFERYSKGLYKVNGMQLYVNQGTGYWGPSLRLGTYCELTVITLKKA